MPTPSQERSSTPPASPPQNKKKNKKKNGAGNPCCTPTRPSPPRGNKRHLATFSKKTTLPTSLRTRQSGKQASVDTVYGRDGTALYVVKTFRKDLRLKSKGKPWEAALKEHTALLRLQGNDVFVKLSCEQRGFNVFTSEKLPCPAPGNEVETVYLEPLVEAPQDERWWDTHKDTFLAAIAFMHAQGVVHGDLRRDNIMCRSYGGTPVIIDFGRARIVDPASESTTDTLEMIFPTRLAPPPSMSAYRVC